jgi:galactokinase
VTGEVLDQMSASARPLLDEAVRRADEVFRTIDGGTPARRLFVPGRIEVLGKHTDYAGGQSLTCAVERGFAVSYSPRRDALVRIFDAQDARRAEFPVSPDLAPPVGQWSNYPMTVARRLARNFSTVTKGADIGFYSNLSRAAGLSTSSALITAVFLVLTEVNRLEHDPRYVSEIGSRWRLAGYLGSIENGKAFLTLPGDQGVGTSGGSQDHTAILLSEAGLLAVYRYHPVARTRQLVLPEDLTFVVASSGIAAAKTGSARERYNRAASLVATLVQQWRDATGRDDATLAEALESSSDAAERLREIAARASDPHEREALRVRLEHVLVENNEILPAALAALDAHGVDDFGRLVDRSQEAAERLLGNQVPETSALAALARTQGALAASAFGAGFGGSVWALVETSRADAFLNTWRRAYRARFPKAAASSTFFVTRPGPGAGSLDLADGA